MLRRVLFLGICSFVAVGVAMAQNVAVGTCRPSLNSFTTIQAAVNAVASGGTVFVCPGSYPEQVVIAKNLTVKGIANGNLAAAIVVAPAGGLQANTNSLTTGLPIAAQVLVKAPATDVTVMNIVVDGSNNGLSGCTPNLAGIVYQNASGVIRGASVQNQVVPSSPGCNIGLGIFVQSGSGGTSNVTVSNNYVQNYQKNGITGSEAGTTLTATGNTVIGQGPTTGAAENSIQVSFGASGTVQGNVVGNDVYSPDTINNSGAAATGILVFASSGVTVATNTVNNTQFGIAVGSSSAGAADGTTITGNKISTTHIFDGIDLCSNNNIAKTNVILGSDEAGVHVDDSCTGTSTGNAVTNNTINTACAGILSGSGASGNTITPNTYVNVGMLAVTGSQCTPPLALATQRRQQHSLSPARP